MAEINKMIDGYKLAGNLKVSNLEKILYNIKFPAFVNRGLIDYLYLPILKKVESLNKTYYPIKKQPLFTSDTPLYKIEKKFYNEILGLIDPEGIFCYNCDLLPFWERGDRIPDVGDRCLFHFILLAIIALKVAITQADEDYKLLNELMRGAIFFVDENGYLQRGWANYYKKEDKEWIRLDKTMYPIHGVSGDQSSGWAFGLYILFTLLNRGYLPKINQDYCMELRKGIRLLADTMIKDDMRLRDRFGNISYQELPYQHPLNLNGLATSKLAILKLAMNEVSKEKYGPIYLKLSDKYNYKELVKYADIYLWSWDNYFGRHIAALGLTVINEPYSLIGLSKIVRTSRDFGTGLFYLLDEFAQKLYYDIDSVDPNYYNANQIKSWLYSYEVIGGEAVFDQYLKKSKITEWVINKISDTMGLSSPCREQRVSALSHRSVCNIDYFPQKPPFVEPNNYNPDLWVKSKFSRVDFLLEYWLAIFLKIIARED